MGHQLVSHHAVIDVEKLHVSLAAGEARPGHPAGEAQRQHLMFDMQGILQELAPHHITDTPLLITTILAGRQAQ
ncbi:hypothetical protein QQ73_05540, partial [Candidatus Endoriftia persephone str. Guaymas]|nr:hypothetical protein [Candidatus Endoriftia persephone str. Guaymas]